MFGNIHVYTNTCMYERKIDKKEGHNFEEAGDEYMGRFGGGKEKGEVLPLKHSLKIKQSKLTGKGFLFLTIINLK